MIEAGGGRLRLGVLPMLAWEQAKQRYRSGGPPDAEQAVFQRAAGLYDDEGTPEPHWAEALAVSVTADAGLVLVATMGDVVFLSTVHLAPATTVLARSRAVSEGGRITRMEPVVEVTMGAAEATWDVLARAVAPHLTAEPKPGPRERVSAGKVPPSGMSLEGLAAWEGAVDELRRAAEAALSPDATLTLTWGGPGIDGPNSLMWFSRGDEFYRVDRDAWDRIHPGDLADELVTIAGRIR